ncbi:hypothetical protein PR202_gb05511 [Eleusine coracana subsp. coracana]|uniref:Uncharacterized protein n=1 Tax=Eleusine coracana subsp. coracana TaxID=191504 RepID=A0AAV5E4P6_ELECO|nr:hypothetical protein PR202_gb05511 [Eleusine coracana subsp. coracana]
MASHLRSSSVLSSPRSNEADVERQLQSLEATISSPSATVNTMCAGFKRLRNIYNCIEEMMCIPSNQVSLCQVQHRKAAEEELARSLVVLDLCSTMQETFLELKMIVQELLMVLKRGESVATQFKAYIQLTKSAYKQFKKICKKVTSDEMDCKVVKQLAEARLITTLLLESTSCLLTKQIDAQVVSDLQNFPEREGSMQRGAIAGIGVQYQRT